MPVMRLFTLILLMISTAVLSGCAGYKPAGNAVHHELVAPYRVDSGDRLRVIVFGQNDLTNTYMVDKAGAISMPLIGGVPVRGRTTAEIADAIAARLTTISPRATEVAKYMIHAGAGEDAPALIEALAAGMTAATADRAEGVAAFRAKRKPEFPGE